MVIRRSGANVSSAKVPTATQFFLGFSWHSDGYKKSQNRRRRRQQQKCKRGTVTLTRAGGRRQETVLPSLRGNGNLFCLATKRATTMGGRARHGDWNVRECTYAELPTAFFSSPIHSQRVSERKRLSSISNKGKENFTLNRHPPFTH